MFGVMVFATIEQFGREMPQPEHALKNAFVLAGLFFVGPGRYTLGTLFNRRRDPGRPVASSSPHIGS